VVDGVTKAVARVNKNEDTGEAASTRSHQAMRRKMKVGGLATLVATRANLAACSLTVI
jgi:hypothetical protein